VTYNGLPTNPTLITQANINAVNVTIQVTDAGGIVTSNSYSYDGFNSTNFTWECEDYDFGGGLFIDNPVMTFTGPGPNTYYQRQFYYPFPDFSGSYFNTIDASDNGRAGGTSRLYRDPLENVETEFAIGGNVNGGPINLGELWRQKVLDAYNVTNIANEVNIGYFDGGTTGSGVPNWMNYTRTYPAGNYNVFLRAANGGAGSAADSLDLVTDGWGTTSQTLTNLGTFTYPNSGSWDNFEWVPLRDAGGNLARVQLNGSTNTIRLTAGVGAITAGANVNFLMLVPANTNLPSISGIYPNGTNLFQPSPTLTFVASTPTGVTISTNSISVQLTVTNLLGIGFTTNITATNGLSFTGQATNWTVSLALISNEVYTASISVKDVNGSPAAQSVSFDTLSPVFTWEAEDYDHDSGQFIDNPAPDAYAGLAGVEGVDAHNISDAPNETFVYRNPQPAGSEGAGNADQVAGDAPRLQYVTNSLSDYNLGWYDGGEWDNYTRTYPAGEYNIYLRGANGSGGTGVSTMAVVTSGVGTLTQTTTNLGTFTQNSTGNWQGYSWTPLRDSGGNLVKFTGGSVVTLRHTSGGNLNPNFFAFFPANTNLPTLSNPFPVTGSQLTNTFSFGVQSTAGVTTNNIVVNVNGTNVSPVITGNQNNWTVTYPHLLPNTTYTIVVTVTDLNGNTSSTTATFDTINPNNYVWEAEDYDYNDGQFFDNPQTNAYNGLPADVGVDAFHTNPGGTYTYRPTGLAGGAANDFPLRPKYTDPNNPQVDGSVGFFSNGSWANYTRNYPAGTYYVFGRFATQSAGTDAQLGEVTSGWGTTTQSSNILGSFTVPNTGSWTVYQYVPMRDASGNLATVTLNGSTNTLQVIRPTETPGTPDLNVNFMMLVPTLTATASLSGTNVIISFPALAGWNYQVQYKTNLTDPTWNVAGTVPGNSGTQSVTNPITSPTRFYRVQIQ
jgi:hypothetical protein